jgi:hypothetical protein
VSTALKAAARNSAAGIHSPQREQQMVAGGSLTSSARRVTASRVAFLLAPFALMSFAVMHFSRFALDIL